MHPNGTTPSAVRSAARRSARRAQLAEARQVVMYLMRTRLTWPLPTRNGAFPATRIGRLRGGRDHSTVMHGVAVIAARLTSGREDDMAGAVDLHERQEGAELDPLQRAESLLTLLAWAADTIEVWAQPWDAGRHIMTRETTTHRHRRGRCRAAAPA